MTNAIQWNSTELNKIQNRFMAGCLAMAYDLASEARSGSPGAPVLTGVLKGSIRVETTSMGADVVAGGPFNGFNVDYALKQELHNPNGHSGYLEKPFERMFGNDKWKDKYFGKVTA